MKTTSIILSYVDLKNVANHNAILKICLSKNKLVLI